MDAADQKKREAQLRRWADDLGLVLRKSRARDTCRMDYGCYRLEDRATGQKVTGTYPYAYSLDLDGVEEALEGMMDNPGSEELLKRVRPPKA
jgi:hypothetical protein